MQELQFEPHTLDVIFLDAAGTLFEVRDSVGKIYSEVAGRFGVPAPAAELDRAFVDAFQRLSLEGLPRDGVGDAPVQEKRWWRELVKRVIGGRMSPATFQAYFEEVFECFRLAEAWRLFPDTWGSLERLRACGYRLGVISNFDSRLRDLLVNLGISSYFEQVVLSWDVGAAKPDRKIFCRALELMNVPAGRALHVGDSLYEDITGAAEAGLCAVLLDRRDLHAEWKGGRRIRSLGELCDSLAGSSA